MIKLPIGAREAAVMALGAYRRSLAWSDAYLNGIFKKENIDRRDKALATKLCCGVLQNMYAIDYYISLYLKGNTDKLQSVVLDILRVSAYQIIYMDRIPHSAAVNEAVSLAKRFANKGASGLVNAVLRRISENSDTLPRPENDYIFYSHTKEWYDYFAELIGKEKTLELMQSDNTEAPLTLRVNCLKTSVDNVLERLIGEGLNASRHPWLDDCINVINAGSTENIGVFKDGSVVVQDASAALAVIAANPQAGEKVLDACAAPGGKSFLSAMLMNNNGSILSCDIHGKKLSRIASGAERLGIGIVSTSTMDASVFCPELKERFDLVIADVPCSGMGVIRKKPEIRYKSFESIAGLPDIQYAILNNLSNYVKPGGRLVYSTCTLIPEENEGVTGEFLKNNKGFIHERFDLPQPFGNIEGGEITIWPFEFGSDGFYICRMKKI